MINASNAYLENRINKKNHVTLSRQSNEILSHYKAKQSEGIGNDLVDEDIVAEIMMRDGSKNVLSVASGIYRVQAEIARENQLC